MDERKYSEFEAGGDVFRDRLYKEWPRLRGSEVSEEEFEEWVSSNCGCCCC